MLKSSIYQYIYIVLIGTILVIFFSLYLLAAQHTSITSITINVLMPAPFADSIKELVKEFNSSHKREVNIKITRGPLETESVSDLAISSLLLGKSPFDIILLDVTWLPKYAASDWLLPLDNLISKSNWESLAKGARLGNSYKGHIYRFPFIADMGLLYWRKDLMKAPPQTPTELIKVSKSLILNNKVKYGYVWQGRQYEGLSCVFLEVLAGHGGNWLTKAGEVDLDSEASLKAASWLNKLFSSGISPLAVSNFSETEALQAFKSGEAALMRNWPYAFAELNKGDSKVKNLFDITQMVSNEDGKPTATLGSWGFSILKSSENIDQAYEVINYFTSIDTQKYLFKNYGYSPTSSEVFKDKKLLDNYPLLPKLELGLEIAKPRPQTPLYAEISDALQRALSESFTGKLTPKDAMLKAKNITRQILISAGENK
ncbi:MAG: ABC transporter substrate-binding protein [Trichodesmium sp. MAG_R04]|nr:ABC transporter substrate-binding protein [Trichodesmium sp. MAG_R04]